MQERILKPGGADSATRGAGAMHAGDLIAVSLMALHAARLHIVTTRRIAGIDRRRIFLAGGLCALRRSADEIAALAGYESELLDPASRLSLQPEVCRNPQRSQRTDIFVAVGQCTHQGCPPVLRSGAGNRSEFLCPCHTSKFDLARRVFRGGLAPANLVIPDYSFDGDSRVVIGEA